MSRHEAISSWPRIAGRWTAGGPGSIRQRRRGPGRPRCRSRTAGRRRCGCRWRRRNRFPGRTTPASRRPAPRCRAGPRGCRSAPAEHLLPRAQAGHARGGQPHVHHPIQLELVGGPCWRDGPENAGRAGRHGGHDEKTTHAWNSRIKGENRVQPSAPRRTRRLAKKKSRLVRCQNPQTFTCPGAKPHAEIQEWKKSA